MSIETLEQRLKDSGVKDFTPQGLLNSALKSGNKRLIESAQKLVKNFEDYLKLQEAV